MVARLASIASRYQKVAGSSPAVVMTDVSVRIVFLSEHVLPNPSPNFVILPEQSIQQNTDPVFFFSSLPSGPLTSI